MVEARKIGVPDCVTVSQFIWVKKTLPCPFRTNSWHAHVFYVCIIDRVACEKEIWATSFYNLYAIGHTWLCSWDRSSTWITQGCAIGHTRLYIEDILELCSVIVVNLFGLRKLLLCSKFSCVILFYDCSFDDTASCCKLQCTILNFGCKCADYCRNNSWQADCSFNFVQTI